MTLTRFIATTARSFQIDLKYGKFSTCFAVLIGKQNACDILGQSYAIAKLRLEWAIRRSPHSYLVRDDVVKRLPPLVHACVNIRLHPLPQVFRLLLTTNR